MALARRGRRLRDELDEVRDEGQALLVVRGQARIARLAQAPHVPDQRDRPRRVVVALQPPGRDGRVVHGTVEGEVQLDVPLEPVDHRTAAADPEVRRQLVRGEVGEDVPVPWRGFRVGTIGPELRHDAPEVPLVDHVRRVRLAGGRVDGTAAAVVGPEVVVAPGTGRDVDRGAIRGIEPAAVPDHLDDLVLEGLVGRRVTEARGRAGIDRQALGSAVGHPERLDVTPGGADGLLDAVHDRDPVLGDHVLDLEGLPAVRVAHDRSRLCHDQGRVHGLVAGIVIARGLVRPVGQPKRDDGLGDPVPDGGRRAARRGRHVERVAERVHEIVELGEVLVGADGLDVALGEHPVGGVADGLVAGRAHVGGGLLLLDEIARCRRVVGRPGVPHGGRHVEQVPGMDGGRRERAPDCVERGFVPASCDRPFRVVRDLGTGRRLRPGPDDNEACRDEDHPDHGGRHRQAPRSRPTARRNRCVHWCLHWRLLLHAGHQRALRGH